MKDDGGPAFPVSYEVNPDGHQSGMSLRDWFAGMALQGYVGKEWLSKALASNEVKYNNITGACYEWADAMLAARKENK